MAPSRNPAESARPRSRRPRAGLVETFADGSVALDLFGEVGAELVRRDRAAQLIAEFEARTLLMSDGTPVVWVAPHNTLTACRGQAVPGWRCWLCGGVEGNPYALDLAHGLHSGDPEVLTRSTCSAQDRASQPEKEAPR